MSGEEEAGRRRSAREEFEEARERYYALRQQERDLAQHERTEPLPRPAMLRFVGASIASQCLKIRRLLIEQSIVFVAANQGPAGRPQKVPDLARPRPAQQMITRDDYPVQGPLGDKGGGHRLQSAEVAVYVGKQS